MHRVRQQLRRTRPPVEVTSGARPPIPPSVLNQPLYRQLFEWLVFWSTRLDSSRRDQSRNVATFKRHHRERRELGFAEVFFSINRPAGMAVAGAGLGSLCAACHPTRPCCIGEHGHTRDGHGQGELQRFSHGLSIDSPPSAQSLFTTDRQTQTPISHAINSIHITHPLAHSDEQAPKPDQAVALRTAPQQQGAASVPAFRAYCQTGAGTGPHEPLALHIGP